MVKRSSRELFKKRIFIYFFKVRGREGETSVGLPFLRTPTGWAQACKLGIHTDQESNLQSFWLVGWHSANGATQARASSKRFTLIADRGADRGTDRGMRSKPFVNALVGSVESQLQTFFPVFQGLLLW